MANFRMNSIRREVEIGDLPLTHRNEYRIVGVAHRQGRDRYLPHK